MTDTIVPASSQGFLTAILSDPSPVHKLAYADWLDEHGEFRLAAAYRWCGLHSRHPVIYRSCSLVCWFKASDFKNGRKSAWFRRDAEKYRAAVLPDWLFARLRKDISHHSLPAAIEAIAAHLEPEDGN